MKMVLASPHRPVLERCFGPGALLAFDYDGTLAPIASRLELAQMRARTRELLRRVAEQYRVVIISGRSRDDARCLLQGIRLFEVIGNHGMDAGAPPSAEVRSRVEQWHGDLQAWLGDVAGLWLEDKGYSLSIHYRHCADKLAARQRADMAVAHLAGARIVRGKDILNVLLLGAPDKGEALTQLRSQVDSPPLLFVGDDETDEDAFVRMQGICMVGIKVGIDPESAAEYFLRDQAEIDDLLQVLDEGAGHRVGRASHDF